MLGHYICSFSRYHIAAELGGVGLGRNILPGRTEFSQVRRQPNRGSTELDRPTDSVNDEEQWTHQLNDGRRYSQTRSVA